MEMKVVDINKMNMLSIGDFVDNIMHSKNIAVGFIILDRSGIKLDEKTKTELIELNEKYNRELSRVIMKQGLKNTRFAKTIMYKEHYK